jgi:hypothetical protein
MPAARAATKVTRNVEATRDLSSQPVRTMATSRRRMRQRFDPQPPHPSAGRGRRPLNANRSNAACCAAGSCRCLSLSVWQCRLLPHADLTCSSRVFTLALVSGTKLSLRASTWTIQSVQCTPCPLWESLAMTRLWLRWGRYVGLERMTFSRNALSHIG